MKLSSSVEDMEPSELVVFPIPVKRGEVLHIEGSGEKISDLIIMNATGQMIRQIKWQGSLDVSTSEMVSGLYFIINKSASKSEIKKFMIQD